MNSNLIAEKYELLGMIGRGGMGAVWEGRHVSLGTRVAIKFIEAEYAKNDEAAKRFNLEARSAAMVDSNNAIRILDHGVTSNGQPFIVMEYLQGESLDARLERVNRLSLRETATILQQVSRALTKAHGLGIVHRDLKPENVFLAGAPGEDTVAKVLDFGIAKLKSVAEESGASTTQTGAVLGTPNYMSPEQVRGLPTLDHRSDLWSLGVIAYQCVTGQLPFGGDALGALVLNICVASLPVPTQINPGIHPAFDAWFARAVDRDPERRFQSAEELANALLVIAGSSLRGTARIQFAEEPTVRQVEPPHLTSSSMAPPERSEGSFAPWSMGSAERPSVAVERAPKRRGFGLAIMALFLFSAIAVASFASVVLAGQVERAHQLALGVAPPPSESMRLTASFSPVPKELATAHQSFPPTRVGKEHVRLPHSGGEAIFHDR